jgi:hypothetical protein
MSRIGCTYSVSMPVGVNVCVSPVSGFLWKGILLWITLQMNFVSLIAVEYETWSRYSNFSTFGASGGDGQRLVNGMPVLQSPREIDIDLRGTQNISMEVTKITEWAAEKLRNGQGSLPWFRTWRVIIQPASVFADLARLSEVAAPNLVWVSALELGLLAKTFMQQHELPAPPPDADVNA